MKKTIICLTALSLLLLAAGCSERNVAEPFSPQVVHPQSGAFGLSKLGALAKRNNASEIKEGPGVAFDLGEIKASTGFFFLLYNIGATPITGVTLSIEDEPFTVYPQKMDSLIPGSDIGMLPIVKISAFHGTPYDGVGIRPMLPMGKNDFTLVISGTTTTSDGSDTTVTLYAAMSLEALVMDFDVEGMNGAIDLESTNPVPMQIFEELPDVMDYRMPLVGTRCTGDSVIAITNTGNVPLSCRIYRTTCSSQGCPVVADSMVTVEPENALQYTITDDNDDYYLFILSGDNAVSNRTLQDDGSYYFSLELGTSECGSAEINDRRVAYLAERENVDCSSLWGFIDTRVMFYAQSFNQGDSVYMEMYDLVTGTVLVTYTGDIDGGEYDCRTEEQIQYCEDLKNIVSILSTSSDLKILNNGGVDRISSGGSRRWDESGFSEVR
ncbi:MAG: hypothetical protein JW863_03455 [Chitinispirillaceae bacterium]|nr:hypothetical protein [Chitinispirillaceae bacterium]